LKNVIILSSASDDLEAARLFYESQSAGWGEHCVDSVLTALASLADISGVHSRHHGYYRMINKTFHLGIYYRERTDDALVIAILDLRRDPKWIHKQLRQRRTG
jgi:plasmid stabilization system protein ParE